MRFGFRFARSHRVGGGRWRSAFPALVSVGLLLSLLSLLSLVVTPFPAFAAGPSGYDVSFPNCGQPLPTAQPDLAIVGVEGGRSFTVNPCLAEEFRWAGSHGRHFEVFINTSYPAGSNIHRGDTGPRGTCRSDDRACKAYNYGFNNAEYAFHYAQSQYAVADTWWLDVETANDWSDDPALNAQVIQGAVDSLRAHRLLVGIYSIPPMWREIVGNHKIDLPKWVVRLKESVQTARYCDAANGFGGGTVALVQDQFGSIDQDYACPVDAFAGQPTYVPFPLSQTQYGQLFGTHGGASTFYALPARSPGVTRSLTFDYAPFGADVANAIFLTVSQGNTTLAEVRGTDTPTPGHLSLTFTPQGTDPIIVRIQTFNYENVPPISYRLTPD